jgi:pimeloyl-ACP methyl ester carboxylesterase
MKRRNDASTKTVPPPLHEPDEVPPGRFIELPGRGTTFVRELGGPSGAPAVILLHGILGTAGTNWLTTMGRLGQRFRVLALDLRGHGRGIRPKKRFRLVDNADDVAALASELGISRAIVGGYSMGGPIAQLTWQRHRALVSGLVFAATSYQFIHGAQARVFLSSWAAWGAQTTRAAEIAGRVPWRVARGFVPTLVPTSGSLGRWGADEMRRHHPRSVIEASREISVYDAGSWIGDVDVPTALVLTTRDNAVEPLWQLRLARAIRGAAVHPIDDGHVTCGTTLFGEVFTDACVEVAERVAVPAREAIAPNHRR